MLSAASGLGTVLGGCMGQKVTGRADQGQDFVRHDAVHVVTAFARLGATVPRAHPSQEELPFASTLVLGGGR